MDAWLQENLVCPRDRHQLQIQGNTLICPLGHKYPYIDGIPVMLLEESEPTHHYCCESLEQTKGNNISNYRDWETSDRDVVDSYVQQEIAKTCGVMYIDLINKLTRYPIPELRLPPASPGQYFLDIGCNWGRWCISAAKKGYITVGIDPSLEAVQAARRVAQKLGVSVNYVVADARYLPFANSSFDLVFSYSVLQHFAESDARLTIAEVARVMKDSGVSLIQMPNKFGVRNLYNQVRRGFKAPTNFQVRYWTVSDLGNTFSNTIGPTDIFVDGFFSVNSQPSDLDILPLKYRLVVLCSEALRGASQKLPWMKYFADSLYLKSTQKVK